MTRRAILLLSLLLVLGAGGSARVTAQAVPRLIADNRTQYRVEIYHWDGSSWKFVSRVPPKTRQPFPNAASGSRWRAMIGQTAREHLVNYVWHSDYGGYQDVWLIQ